MSGENLPSTILVVTPRYGAEVVGGAETLIRGYAEKILSEFAEVSVATTCARSVETWENELPEGVHSASGVPVHRFPVMTDRLSSRHNYGRRATHRTDGGKPNQRAWSPGLQRFLRKEGQNFDLVLTIPLALQLVQTASLGVLDRVVVIPCLHDEPCSYAADVRRILWAARGCLANSAEEARLIRRLVAVRRLSIVSAGLDPARSTRESDGDPAVPYPYILYAGRLEDGKGLTRLSDVFMAWQSRIGTDVRLVLVGSGSWTPLPAHRGHVLIVGERDEEARTALIRQSMAVVTASTNESLSLLLLEGWRQGTPSIATARSRVMADMTSRSGGGVTFDAGVPFDDAITRLFRNPDLRNELGTRGRDYVNTHHSWEAVGDRLRNALAQMMLP